MTVQYPENQVKSLEDLKAMPLRAPNLKLPTYLNQVADVTPILTPTEVDHYQLQRTIDVYVAPPEKILGNPQQEIRRSSRTPNCRRTSGSIFAGWLSRCSRPSGVSASAWCWLILLVYLVLVAQFASFIDPFLIVLAVPTGLDRSDHHPGFHRIPR